MFDRFLGLVRLELRVKLKRGEFLQTVSCVNRGSAEFG